MKVIIVTTESFPNGMAAVKRILCYAKALKYAGVDTEVLIMTRTEPYYKKSRNSEGSGIIEGIPFRYIGGTPHRARNVLKRKFYDYVDMNNTIKYFETNLTEGDAVLCYFREDNRAIKISHLCKKKKIKVLRDLCEYPFVVKPENDNTKKLRENYLASVFPLFDGVIAISHSLYDFALEHNVRAVRVPIMIDVTEINTYKQTHSTPYLFHSGTLSEQKDGILGALKAFGIAKQQFNYPIHYYLTGNLDKSPVSGQIRSIMEEYHLENSVSFLGYLEKEELLEYQSGSEALIINKHQNLQNQYCFATKLGEYLLSGRPVITTRVGEAPLFLSHGQNALLYDDGDVQRLSDLIIEAFTKKEKMNIIGAHGKDLAIEQFDYKRYGKTIREFISTL